MKKIVIVAMAAAMCVFAVSCGNNKSNKDNGGNGAAESLAKEIAENTPEGAIVGYTGDAAADLKKLDATNYQSIVKGIFGVDVTPQEGWTVYKAKSPNGVNNADIIFTKEGDIEEQEVKRAFVNQLLEVSEDGVYTLNIDFDTFAISKGDKIESFEDFVEKASGKSLYYVYGGKGIQGSASARSASKSVVEYQLCLTQIN